MKFSIIIPLYNKAAYIRKAVESVLAQTFTDWELIVVNDGSTDNSRQVVEDFLQSTICNGRDGCQYSIHLINQPNSGVSAARNNGIAMAKGEYIAFLDADDWWAPTFLESILSLITNTQDIPNIGLYATNYYTVKNGKNRWGVTYVAWQEQRMSAEIQYGLMDYWNSYLRTTGGMPITSITVVISRDVMSKMKGFPIGIKLGEDFMLWAKIALHYKIAFLNQPLAFYNFDADANGRAITQLHAPESHMLFHLEEYERQGHANPAVKAMLDKSRVTGLLPYWLDSRYHHDAEVELQKVDWTQQPRSIRRKYNLPIWMVKGEQRLMQIGSWCKQNLIRLICH